MVAGSGSESRISLFAVLSREKIPGFFLIGVLTTAIDVVLLYLLISGLGVWYLASATVSYSCGMTVNFLLNKCLNFHDTGRRYAGRFSRSP